jgi:hypothetical protein
VKLSEVTVFTPYHLRRAFAEYKYDIYMVVIIPSFIKHNKHIFYDPSRLWRDGVVSSMKLIQLRVLNTILFWDEAS